MKRSERGFFYGDTTELIRLDGVTLTDTVYGQSRIDSTRRIFRGRFPDIFTRVSGIICGW